MKKKWNDAGGLLDAMLITAEVWDLYIIKAIFNEEGYVYRFILKSWTILHRRHLTGANFLLRQNNEPKHSSRLCKKYLETKQSDGILSVTDWLDLNPVVSAAWMYGS